MPNELHGSSASAVRHVIDLMGRFGAVHARPMFGGHGMFRSGIMFAILIKGDLYLKVDDASRIHFAQRNLRAFTYQSKGRPVQLSYHEAPADAMEDEAVMAEWCERAWQAALRSKGGA